MRVSFGSLASTFLFLRIGMGTPGATIRYKRPHALEAIPKPSQIEIDCDLRLSAFVSLLKAAHLSLFEVLGYRYALSVAGHFLGQTILGAFFSAHRTKPKSEVIRAAKTYFAEFASMLRPVIEPDTSIKGTVADRRILVCHANSGGFWSQIVFIPTGELLHSVMLPIWDRPDMSPVFLEFLHNDHEGSMPPGLSTPIEVGGSSQRRFLWSGQRKETSPSYKSIVAVSA